MKELNQIVFNILLWELSCLWLYAWNFALCFVTGIKFYGLLFYCFGSCVTCWRACLRIVFWEVISLSLFLTHFFFPSDLTCLPHHFISHRYPQVLPYFFRISDRLKISHTRHDSAILLLSIRTMRILSLYWCFVLCLLPFGSSIRRHEWWNPRTRKKSTVRKRWNEA